ncbi:MAG: 50S ribosomal protein L21 [Candidatus Marinimicrobia bacterium]|nr:50S ribosomal protein L21 [Candidatus Neomarinimicrobiota bacterium]
MLAIVDISGKQFKVEPGLELRVPLQNMKVGEKVSYDRILLLDNDKKVKVGTPTVINTTIEATVLEHGRSKKIIVFKKKRRKGYQTKNSHRQGYTLIRVDSIKEKATKKAKTSTKKTTKDSNSSEKGE